MNHKLIVAALMSLFAASLQKAPAVPLSYTILDWDASLPFFSAGPFSITVLPEPSTFVLDDLQEKLWTSFQSRRAGLPVLKHLGSNFLFSDPDYRTMFKGSVTGAPGGQFLTSFFHLFSTAITSDRSFTLTLSSPSGAVNTLGHRQSNYPTA